MEYGICPVNASNIEEVCLLTDFVPPKEDAHSIPCYNMKAFNSSEYSSVIVTNATQLLVHLGRHEPGMCAIVLFYAAWCPFSIKMAAMYNALGRYFSGIPLLAVEVPSQLNGLNIDLLRFGIVSVPNVFIFRKERAIGKYNQSEMNIDGLVNFLGDYMDINSFETGTCFSFSENLTDHCMGRKYAVTADDYVGPIDVKFKERTDWLLLFSIMFLIFVAYNKYKK